jgi:hypothetical protein
MTYLTQNSGGPSDPGPAGAVLGSRSDPGPAAMLPARCMVRIKKVPLWDQEAIQARQVPLWDQEAL